MPTFSRVLGGLFRRKGNTPPDVAPKPSDDVLLSPIVAFARGDESKRAEAVWLHRMLLGKRPDLRTHPAQRFMAEVDTPAPDLGLRAAARASLVA